MKRSKKSNKGGVKSRTRKNTPRKSLGKQAPKLHKLIFPILILGLLLSYLFYHISQKNNYITRYFCADDELNIAVSGKENYEVFGLDVSRHQGQLDWAKVNAHKVNQHPISFVFLKASEGVTHIDMLYAENYQRAKANGFICGAYHYYKDKQNAGLQAEHFLRTAKLSSGDLAPVLDVEELNEDDVPKSLANILSYLKLMEKHYHTKPIFYTYDYLYSKYFRGTELENYPLWIAHYSLPDREQPQWKWDFWQYSCRGRLKACSSDFDLNVFRSSIKDFESFLIP